MAYFTAGRRDLSNKCLQDLISRGDARNIAQVYAWRNERDRAF